MTCGANQCRGAAFFPKPCIVMGWLCCYGAGDSLPRAAVPTTSGRVDGSKPAQRAPLLPSNELDYAIVAEHRAACCVLARKTPSSHGPWINTRDGVGGLPSAPHREEAGAILMVVAANARCLAHLGVPSLGDTATALIKAAHGSKLFWVALESAITDGDAAGHLAAALPDGTVVSFSACNWQQGQAVMLEWQPAPVTTAQPPPPPDYASARSHELVSDERFPAALT